MELKPIFKNQFDELRAGWQLLLFILAFSIAALAVVGPLILLKRTDMFSMSMASLVAVIIASFVCARFVNKKSLAAIGLSLNQLGWKEFGLGCLAGWLMMTGIFGIEYALGYTKVEAVEISFVDGLKVFGYAFLFFGVAALFEEVLFRGYLFQTLARGINVVPATVLTGILFGLAHLGNPNASVFGIANTFLVSIVLCLAYWKTRSLWLPFGIHFAWNFSQTTLYGFPTSGADFTRHELTRLTQFGPEWITGGAYGPEGGALATLTIILCGAYLYFSRSLQPTSHTVTLEREGEQLDIRWLERRNAA